MQCCGYSKIKIVIICCNSAWPIPNKSSVKPRTHKLFVALPSKHATIGTYKNLITLNLTKCWNNALNLVNNIVLQAGILYLIVKYEMYTTYSLPRTFWDFELMSDCPLDILNYSCKYPVITAFLNAAIVNLIIITLTFIYSSKCAPEFKC
jgi:hypothetical protein